jgi:amidase
MVRQVHRRGHLARQAQGKKVVLKDNYCLAGVPMTNGASTLEGYVPDVDAHGRHPHPRRRRHDRRQGRVRVFLLLRRQPHSSTGPSTTRAAWATWRRLIERQRRAGAAGEVPMALGGDQGGSIRIPAAYCGVYGMKPTHGLVPYTGIMPIEATIDHTGPITATVEDNALLLEVLAGPDGPRPAPVRPREAGALHTQPSAGPQGNADRLVTEGFDHPQSLPAVDRLVRAAAEDTAPSGPEVTEGLDPDAPPGQAIWLPVAAEGGTMQMMLGNGYGFNCRPLRQQPAHYFPSGWRNRAVDRAGTTRSRYTMLLGHYMVQHYRGHYYAKAQNLVRRLRAAYDAVLATTTSS